MHCILFKIGSTAWASGHLITIAINHAAEYDTRKRGNSVGSLLKSTNEMHCKEMINSAV